MLNIFRKGASKPSKEKVEKYRQAADSWEKDYLRSAKKRETIAWGAFAFMSVVAATEAVAIFALAPMKEKVPYLLRVDNTTGIVDEMVLLTEEKELSADKQLNRYWINKYINARESYQYKFANEYYQTTYYMSESKVAIDYKNKYTADSPVRKYGDTTQVEIKIKTFELNNDDRTAVVRILETVNRQGERPIITHYLIRLSYNYLSQQKLPQSVRNVTPLGFIVTGYSKTRENYQ